MLVPPQRLDWNPLVRLRRVVDAVKHAGHS